VANPYVDALEVGQPEATLEVTLVGGPEVRDRDCVEARGAQRLSYPLGTPLGQYSHMTRVKASEFLFIAGMLVFINLVVDVLYAYFDPRVRYERDGQ